MKITVENKDLLAACKADYEKYSRTEICLVAQAVKRLNPGKEVNVYGDHANVDGVRYHIGRKAKKLIHLFDHDIGGLPTRKARAEIKSLLPCELTFRKQ